MTTNPENPQNNPTMEPMLPQPTQVQKATTVENPQNNPTTEPIPPQQTQVQKATTVENPQNNPTMAPIPPQPSPNDHAQSAGSANDTKKWGTHVMGQPAAPGVHPDNQQAATWTAGENQHPYLQCSPVERQPSANPIEPVINMFNSWSRRTEDVARSIWHNLNMGPSLPQTAWDKANLTAKAITGGGFEQLFKQTFQTEPNEKLFRTFACYLSTSTGPVAGTLYLSTLRVAFCSDRPLSFKAPSGQESWSYYKVMIPLANIATVDPVTMKEKPEAERYIQIKTVDGHEFWFMGFVNFEKASNHLLNSVSNLRAAETQGKPAEPGF